MVRRMSVRDARAKFSEMLGSVHFTNSPVIIERNGKPYAVVISPKAFERLKEHDWEVIDRIRDGIESRNAHLNPDEEYEFITSVVEEVRRERREQLESAIARRA
jgi:prevent-host-death family protein